jgi:uncharacterized protein YlaN (UPF0358 family)
LVRVQIYTIFKIIIANMTLTEADIINAISDVQSLDLFKAIAQASVDSDILIKKSRLTRKQYYSRMSRMTKVGLIQRKNGKYFLTSLGRVTYQAHTIIENALTDYWKLKAIDSLDSSTSTGLPQEEHDKILNTLIDNHQIKQILLVNNR